ncbi:GlxA family transcriptional regulator [Hahella ganghwensis]|uniref:GlxA family transcriptional regulator n=1 Tax=Hahella ganghwensis TaxID=286420 RepID=UPI000373691D|nr:helix-turn-helix domain-containing protein [Hahella ganghwensis]
MDLAAPAQIFAHDSLEGLVELHYISPSEDQSSYQGLHLTKLEALPEQLPNNSWLLLIGTSKLARHLDEPEYRHAVEWLRLQSQGKSLIAGICSGTLLAAKAGMLDGKRCTTHHELTDVLRTLAPEARVQEDCIFVNDGHLWSSAGITTGLDLCLQLVADHWGHGKALEIARSLVLYQRRSGHEQQVSFWLNHRNHIHSRIHDVQDMIMSAPGHSWTLSELSVRVHLSERHLSRMFTRATGESLQDYLQQARVELARQLLEQTRLSLDEIAEKMWLSG